GAQRLRQGKIVQRSAGHGGHYVPCVLIARKIGHLGADAGQGEKAQHGREPQKGQQQRHVGDAQGAFLRTQGVPGQFPAYAEAERQQAGVPAALPAQGGAFRSAVPQGFQRGHAAQAAGREPGREQDRQQREQQDGRSEQRVHLKDRRMPPRHMGGRGVEGGQHAGTGGKPQGCAERQRQQGQGGGFLQQTEP